MHGSVQPYLMGAAMQEVKAIVRVAVILAVLLVVGAIISPDVRRELPLIWASVVSIVTEPVCWGVSIVIVGIVYFVVWRI